MSLINEALKKAQKQRTGETTPLPAIGGESAERIARRSKPAGFNTLLLYGGGGVAALAVVIVAGVFLLRKNPSAPAPAAATVATNPTVAPTVKPPEASAMPPAPAPAAVTVASVAPAAPSARGVAVAPAPAQVVPVVTAPVQAAPPKAETPAPVAQTEAPKIVVAPAPVTPVIAAAPPEPAPTPAKPEPAKPVLPGKLEARAINYIESLHVAGIRASLTDAKVLMNDRVYRIGSVVEREMGLRLTGITANSLTFEDERGASYTRTF